MAARFLRLPVRFRPARMGRMRLLSQSSTRPDRSYCIPRIFQRTARLAGARSPWTRRATLTLSAGYCSTFLICRARSLLHTGAFQTTMPDFPIEGAPQLGFITKLNATGSALIYSTFLYASDDTWIGAFVVD